MFADINVGLFVDLMIFCEPYKGKKQNIKCVFAVVIQN